MHELTRPVPAIVQKLEQDQRRAWDEIVDEITQLALQEDESALTMGDRFAELERNFGSTLLKRAAEEACVSWSNAKQRLWVAKKIPPASPIRKAKLSFGHLVAVAGTNDMERWTNLALKEQLSVKKLRDAIDHSDDVQAQDNGEPCSQCERPLPREGEIVAFTVGKQHRRRCCNVECALHYFAKRVAEQGDLLADGDMHEFPTVDPQDPAQAQLAARFQRLDTHVDPMAADDVE